ncbi:MAG: hypothetical protein RL417_2519 [Pseudomonadota bacterium]
MLLKISPHTLGLIGGPFTVDEREFTPKAETHITLLGFKHSSDMKKVLADPDKGAELQKLADAANALGGLDVTLAPDAPTIRLARDTLVSRKGGEQALEHHESFIVPVAAPHAREIIKSIGAILGRELPEPYLHITLYTHGSPSGIGISASTALDSLTIGEMPAAQFRMLTMCSAAVTVDSPLTPAQCGEALVAALKTSDPVQAFEKLVERTGAREGLGAILAVRHIPQDPRHHPEGDVYIHTLRVVAETHTLCERFELSERERAAALLGALLHDIGKGVPGTTEISLEGGASPRISAHGHERAVY